MISISLPLVVLVVLIVLLCVVIVVSMFNSPVS